MTITPWEFKLPKCNVKRRSSLFQGHRSTLLGLTDSIHKGKYTNVNRSHTQSSIFCILMQQCAYNYTSWPYGCTLVRTCRSCPIVQARPRTATGGSALRRIVTGRRVLW